MQGSVVRASASGPNRLPRLRSCALLCALAGACSAGSLAQPVASAPATVSLGIELPLAGDDGAAGLAARSAVELALDEHNARRPPGAPALRALVRDAALHFANPHQDEGTDNAAEPARAAAVLHEFAADPNVVAALGGLRANVAAAEAPVANGLRLPLLVLAPLPLPCAPQAAPAPSAFGLSGGAALEALATARSLEARGRRFAVFADGETMRGLVAACLATSLRAEGGRVELRASLPPGDNAALARLRVAQRRDAVDTVAYVAPAERGTLVCSERAAESLERAEALAEIGHRGYDPASVPAGCRWVVRRLPPRDAAYEAFVQRYRHRFLEAPSDEAAMAYAATQVLAQAVDAAAADSPRNLRSGVREALAGKSFETVLGPVRFAADGAATAGWFDTGASAAPLLVSQSP